MTAAGALPPPDFDLARDLFSRLQRESFDGTGITRASYGAGEQFAHALVAETARGLGLEIARDAALNLYLTLPGSDRTAPRAMTGSHLDSVPSGGNYDGAAGVIAGLAVLAGWRRAGFVPGADATVMAIRAEESTWFPVSYLGSRAAFGTIPRAVLDARRVDTGRTLAEHLAECGGDPEAFGRDTFLDPARIARFVELHIEQGPVLTGLGIALGAVSGIRGSFRFRDARAIGEYAHSGATPRGARRDAVRAAALLIAALDDDWQQLEAEGRDLVMTVGQLATDPAQHAFSKVAGEIALCLDVRSLEPGTLERVEALVRRRAAEIGARTAVAFELGSRTGSEPAAMDPGVQRALNAAAARHGIAMHTMASGAGHDAATFAARGVPSGMLFVRNDRGSHNPAEAMDFADFELGTRVLGDVLAGA